MSTRQIIFQRRQFLVATRISLATATTKQLSIDTTRFVSFSCDHVQAATFRYAISQLDISAAPCHICRNRDLLCRTGAGDDLRLLRILTCV